MILNCLVSTFCCNADLEGLQLAGTEIRQLAEDTSGICVRSRDKGQIVTDSSREVTTALRDLDGVDFEHPENSDDDGDDPDGCQDRGRIGDSMKTVAATLAQMQRLIESEHLQQAKQMVSEMDDMAFDCINKSKAMKEAMQKGIDALPDPVKDDLASEEPNDEQTDDDTAAIADIADIDESVADLENATRSLEKMNIFSAAAKGVDAFDGLTSKEELVGNLFESIRQLATTILRLSEAWMMSNNCCAQVQAFASEASNMYECIRSCRIIAQTGQALRKLLQAMLNFLDVAWTKLQGLVRELQAARKIKKFCLGRYPSLLKNSKLGGRIQQGIEKVQEGMDVASSLVE